jgi:hypothetical protein
MDLTKSKKYDTISLPNEREVTIMAKNTFYWFTFEDGYCCCTRGFSAQERRVEERKHGKIVSKVLA